MNKQQRKEQALKYLKQLDIYKPYIDGFEKENQVCVFERFAGFWVHQYPEIYKKMQQIEKEYKCTVYAITHEFTPFGECYSFLIVTNYKHEWKTLLQSNKNKHTAFAYVWNKTDDWCSEFGTVTVQNQFGSITRIG
jgi:hypothetical protein